MTKPCPMSKKCVSSFEGKSLLVGLNKTAHATSAVFRRRIRVRRSRMRDEKGEERSLLFSEIQDGP